MPNLSLPRVYWSGIPLASGGKRLEGFIHARRVREVQGDLNVPLGRHRPFGRCIARQKYAFADAQSGVHREVLVLDLRA